MFFCLVDAKRPNLTRASNAAERSAAKLFGYNGFSARREGGLVKAIRTISRVRKV